VTPDIAKAMGLDANTRGVLIDTVTAGGPAAKAGLLASTQQVTINGQAANVGGDIVTAIDGQPVKSFNDLGSYLFVHTEAGQTVTLTLLRGSKTTTVKVTTGVLPAN
jgi:S1-C subfamily serine protease